MVRISGSIIKIQVQLSAEDYQKYLQPSVGRNHILASTFHSSIILATLIHALYQLLNEPTKDDYNETAWAQIIRTRIDNEGAAHGLAMTEDAVLEIAQFLLDNPLERLLTDLQTREIQEDE